MSSSFDDFEVDRLYDDARFFARKSEEFSRWLIQKLTTRWRGRRWELEEVCHAAFLKATLRFILPPRPTSPQFAGYAFRAASSIARDFAKKKPIRGLPFGRRVDRGSEVEVNLVDRDSDLETSSILWDDALSAFKERLAGRLLKLLLWMVKGKMTRNEMAKELKVSISTVERLQRELRVEFKAWMEKF